MVGIQALVSTECGDPGLVYQSYCMHPLMLRSNRFMTKSIIKWLLISQAHYSKIVL
jgi:hypothetical protein